MSIFQHYDRIRVVSLPERKDRRAAIAREMNRVGADFRFFDAYRVSRAGPFMSPGAFGCFLSHMMLLGEAAADGQSILIVEDDCCFTTDAAVASVPDVDLYWAGYEDRTPDYVIGTQMLGYSAKTATRLAAYLPALLDPTTPGDADAMKHADYNPAIRPPYDGALVWFLRANPDLTVAFAQLARQRPSRSDITPGSVLDTVPVVRSVVQWARELREAARRRSGN